MVSSETVDSLLNGGTDGAPDHHCLQGEEISTEKKWNRIPGEGPPTSSPISYHQTTGYDVVEEERDTYSVDMNPVEQDQDDYSPSKKVSIALAQSMYERGMLYKATTRKKVEDELKKMQSPSRKIPLSKATDLYERCMNSREKTLLRIEEAKKAKEEQEKEGKEEVFSPSNTKHKVSISVSRASALYDRSVLMMKERDRKLMELREEKEQKEVATLPPRKMISIAKGASTIYDRGMVSIAKLEKKRKEESMKKRWR